MDNKGKSPVWLSLIAALCAFTVLYSAYGLIHHLTTGRIVLPFPLAWRYLVNANLPVAIDHIINLVLSGTFFGLILESRRAKYRSESIDKKNQVPTQRSRTD